MMPSKTLTAIRGAAIAGLLLAVGSCTDSSMLVGARSIANVSIQPSFDGVSFDAAPVVDKIHFVFTRVSTNKVVLDTIVTVAPGATNVTLNFKLTLQSDADNLKVTLDLLQAGTVLYEGTQTLVVTSGAITKNTATVTVSYVGPGATAHTVTVSPNPASISSAGAQQFTAVVNDASGAVLSGVPVVWSVSDATLGSISTSGLFTGTGRRGAVSITATTWSGVSGSASVALLPAATRVVVVSGNNQLAMPATALPQPVVVETDGVDGPVAGVPVNFDAGTTGGSVNPASAVTDASGRASVQLTLGKTTGAQQFNATSPGLAPAAITATATAGLPASITIVSGDGQADSTGTTLAPFVVKVSDRFGNPVPGATVSWSSVDGGSLLAPTSTTDASGLASATLTLGRTPGVYHVNGSVQGTVSPVVFAAVAIVRGVAKLVAGPGVDGQTGTVGTTLPVPFTVVAQDILGDALPGVAVTFTAVTAGGSINPQGATTDGNGSASATMKLGTTPGTYTYTVTSGKVSVTVTETAKLTGGVGLIVPAGSALVAPGLLAATPRQPVAGRRAFK